MPSLLYSNLADGNLRQAGEAILSQMAGESVAGHSGAGLDLNRIASRQRDAQNSARA